MAIIQQPASLSLLGNLNKFVISSASPVTFTLSEGGAVLADELYEAPLSGSFTIDVSQIVAERLSFQLSSNSFYKQNNIAKTFTANVDGQSVSFTVVRAGVANLADTPSNWLKGNFLTWQPNTKAVSYHSPEWLTYYAVQSSTLKLRATFDDDTTQTITLGSMTAGSAYTANLQYAVVAGLLGNRYPIYFDVWAEGSGTALTYTQRYFYSLPKSELEQWFLFENTLGGIDTIRTSGASDFAGANTYELAQINDTVTEFSTSVERHYSQNTGALDEYERQWLKDFFPAYRKYVHQNGAFRAIVLIEDEAQYSTSDLPSSFNFTFRFADDTKGLLNLVRNAASIPPTITLPNLSSPNFILPPRLSEFPRVELGEGVILPAFDPYSDAPKVTTVGALIAAAVYEALQQIPGGDGTPGGGGQLVNIIKNDSLSAGTDNDVFSSLRTKSEIDKAIQAFADSIDNHLGGLDAKFLSKLTDDQAQGLITFLQGINIGEFIPGMFGGKGAHIDKDGNMEATSLRLRAMLEVPELRFNRLTVVGDELILTESGFIESVQHLEGDIYQLNMKLEDGENIAFLEHDLLKGIFHHSTGFATSYMIVTEVGLSFIKVALASAQDVPTGANFPPMDFMKVARVGNATDADRQRYIVASSKLGGIQVFDGASTFTNGTLVGSMDTAQSFKGLYGNLPLKEGLFYQYAAGLVVQDIIRVDYQGVAVREIFDRGPWESGRTYYNNDTQGTDDVWHLGCRWRCFSSSTTAEPGWTSPNWIMIEGRSDARMEIVSSHGFMLPATFSDVVFTPYVFIGNTDVSADIIPEQWRWTRETDNEVADTIWNVQHKEMRALTLSYVDMGANWSRSNPTRFTCTAIYPASSINPIQFILEF